MATPLTIFQAQAQAVYMSELAKIAQEEAVKESNLLSFDPQGRVLIEVTPDAKQKQRIMEKIKNIAPPGELEIDIQALTLNEAVGKMVTPTTTVSLDIKTNPRLKNIFDTQLENALKKIETPQVTTQIMNQLTTKPKGSLIALQQEYYFHLALVARVYEKAAPEDLSSEKMASIHHAATAAVNSLVIEAYAKALKGAMRGNTLDMAKLNKSLDKARKELLPKAHNIMMKAIVSHTGVILTKKQLKEITNPKGIKETIKHVAEGTTATSNDIVHLDSEVGLATLIAGSKNTAHDRIEGNQFAHRQLITHSLKADGRIEANKNLRIQIRTPSPVLKEGLADDNAYINDAVTKLTTITTDYKLDKHLTSDENKPKAFIYNSYTALNDTLGDINGNLQTQSADHILRGAHRYNARQLHNNPDPVFCFVQNISVNGFGDTLGYDTGNPLREESTLMTEMALLHTLYDASPEQQNKIGKVFDQYKKYLQTPHRPSYFSNSQAGKEAKEMIQSLKSVWKDKVNPVSDNIQENVNNGLKNLMANNLHFDHGYSKLFQALSVYAEEASIGGCKSGNERAQAINGRVAILDSLSGGNENSEGMQKIKEALSALAKGGNNVPQTAQVLKEALDTEYNRVGLQSAASVVSLVDQGASAKVEAKNGFLWWWTSRNYAEEPDTVMDNLHQSKAGSMQAHKSLTQLMKEAWDFGPKSWWDRLKSSPLGAVGGVIAIVILPIAIGVGIYNAIDNIERAAKENEILDIQGSANTHTTGVEKNENSYARIDRKLDNSRGHKHPKGIRTPDYIEDEAHQKENTHPGLTIAASLQTTAPIGISSTRMKKDAEDNEDSGYTPQ
ncbi:hypothetical protein TUM19329_06520 [Legionella antarctica]|uniref:Uncharacterized protein n=1 Tax=Legionella antarctica TaxID=2708020 RepID=A0A6F8T1E7_9GAMM|nr:hypothetical protein [Legionella antarctica]BCA94291.1 hypothetical protein TUM19329_06520 [Legionella antarctica]